MYNCIMVLVIIVIAFLSIVLLNFAMGFFSTKKNVKQKKIVDSSILEKVFYDKYNKNPVIYKNAPAVLYEEKQLEKELNLSEASKLLIINSYVALCSSLQSGNSNSLGCNLLLQGCLQKDKKKTGKKKSKEKLEQEIKVLSTDDLKKVLFSLNDKQLKQPFNLKRIISISFVLNKDSDILMTVYQDITLDSKEISPVIQMVLDKETFSLVSINDSELNPDRQKSGRPESFCGLPWSEGNAVIYSTFLAIYNSMEAKSNHNLLMVKNIQSSLYDKIIHKFVKSTKLIEIISMNMESLYDSVHRVKFVTKQQDEKGNVFEAEDYLDFDIPSYYVPELLELHGSSSK